MVEPPGTAPGSDPLITSAFIAIVPKNIIYIGGFCDRWKNEGSSAFKISHIVEKISVKSAGQKRWSQFSCKRLTTHHHWTLSSTVLQSLHNTSEFPDHPWGL